MLADGFYSALFKSPRGDGAGVLTLANGQVRGGDSCLAYSGTFVQEGDSFIANLTTKRHARGLQSVFGLDEVNINLTGKSLGASASCIGTAAETPGVIFEAILTRISD
jgi:hypothetical protein